MNKNGVCVIIHDIGFRMYFGQLAIIPGLVSEIHANFLKDMAWDLTEVNLKVVKYSNRKGAYSVNLVCFILCELARTRQHSLKNICEG